MVYFIIEASHLFRAGTKYQTQFFVMDVVNFIHRKFRGFCSGCPEPCPEMVPHVIVLHGSVKQEQGDRYAAALERHGVKVVRMRPIESDSAGKWFFKPAWYMHKMMGTDIPEGSDVVLVGFHNIRYLKFLEKYATRYNLHVAAFQTPSAKQGMMHVPDEFKPLLKSVIDLDMDVPGIKAEFKKKLSNKA
jgi:hypothetical protein